MDSDEYDDDIADEDLMALVLDPAPGSVLAPKATATVSDKPGPRNGLSTSASGGQAATVDLTDLP